MAAPAQMVVVLEAFVEYCVSLELGHMFESSWFAVSQTDVFHRPSPTGWLQQRTVSQSFSVTVLCNEAQRILI